MWAKAVFLGGDRKLEGRRIGREEAARVTSLSWAIPGAPASFSWCGFPPGCLGDDWPDHIQILRGAAAEPLTRMLSTWSTTKQELNHYPQQPWVQEEGGEPRQVFKRGGVCVRMFLFVHTSVFVGENKRINKWWFKPLRITIVTFQFCSDATEDYFVEPYISEVHSITYKAA